jgi:hypothetical protein
MRKPSTRRIQKMMSNSSSYKQHAVGQPPLLLPVQLGLGLIRTRSHLALRPDFIFLRMLLTLLADGAASWDSLKGAN